MKKILATTIAAIAMAAAPASAQGVSIGGTLRIGDSGYVHIQSQPNYRYRDYREREYHHNYNQHRFGYGCRNGDRLTVRNLPRYNGYLIVDGRRYIANDSLCVNGVRNGDFVFYDRNNNGRFDHSDWGGRVRQSYRPLHEDYYGARAYGNDYTVTLRR